MATGKSAPAAVKNEKTQMDGAADSLPDFSTWTPHQIGFAPYWRPQNPNDWCYMKIVAKDVRNPEFIRFLCTALKHTKCRRGPGNNNADEGPVGEEVEVKPGDSFSISVYYSLAEEFDFFNYLRMIHGLDVPMKLTAVKKTATKHVDGRKVWNWELLSDPVKRPAIEEHRDEFLKLQASNNEETAREQMT